MTPVKHNLSAIKGEFITLTIGYNGEVEPEDLFVWAGGRPVKCLVKGQLTILEGVSNRGK